MMYNLRGALAYQLRDVEDEAARSRDKWGSYRSAHEVYGVLAEEMAELLEAIHRNNDEDARHEALQIAAVAWRFAREGWSRT